MGLLGHRLNATGRILTRSLKCPRPDFFVWGVNVQVQLITIQQIYKEWSLYISVTFHHYLSDFQSLTLFLVQLISKSSFEACFSQGGVFSPHKNLVRFCFNFREAENTMRRQSMNLRRSTFRLSFPNIWTLSYSVLLCWKEIALLCRWLVVLTKTSSWYFFRLSWNLVAISQHFSFKNSVFIWKAIWLHYRNIFIFRISTKHLLLNLNHTSPSRLNLKFKILTKPSFRMSTITKPIQKTRGKTNKTPA